MSKKMKVTTLAVLAALAASSSAFANDTNKVDFTTTIKIEAAEKCILGVSALNGDNTWNLDWKLAEGAKTGTLTPGSGHRNEPLFVKVNFAPESSSDCNLNNMKIDGASAGATATTESNNTFRAQKDDVYWRFMPVMAQLKLFTDADASSGAIDQDKISVMDRQGKSHLQKTTAIHTAKAEITDLAEFKSKPAVALTNNYLAANGVFPLAGDGAALEFTVTDLTKDKPVKSALIGVGVLLAKDPEADTSDIDLKEVPMDAEFTMPYTVNVTMK